MTDAMFSHGKSFQHMSVPVHAVCMESRYNKCMFDKRQFDSNLLLFTPFLTVYVDASGSRIQFRNEKLHIYVFYMSYIYLHTYLLTYFSGILFLLLIYCRILCLELMFLCTKTDVKYRFFLLVIVCLLR